MVSRRTLMGSGVAAVGAATLGVAPAAAQMHPADAFLRIQKSFGDALATGIRIQVDGEEHIITPEVFGTQLRALAACNGVGSSDELIQLYLERDGAMMLEDLAQYNQGLRDLLAGAAPSSCDGPTYEKGPNHDKEPYDKRPGYDKMGFSRT